MIQYNEDRVGPWHATHILTAACLVFIFGSCDRRESGQPLPQEQFTPSSITLKENGLLKELVDESLTFHDPSGIKWVAPKGTLTDGASVPRLALPVTNGQWDPAFLKAAVLHDAYCQSENETRTPKQYRKKPWRDVDKMFYHAMIAGGTPELTAKIMFAAVWLGGPRWDDPGNQLPEMPSEPLTRGFNGSKQWIEQRNPTINDIMTDMDRREPLLRDLYNRETAILDAIEKNNMETARVLIREEEAVLQKELEKSPNDPMLLNFKGYLHKNRAILFRISKDETTANEELNNSERTFKAVTERDQNDPSALNGLGSVSILRGNLLRGEEFVEKALKIAPTYEAAKHDLQLIKKLREPIPDR